MTRPLRLKVEVDGARDAERDLDKIGDAAEGTGRSMLGMGKAADKAASDVDDLGDEARGAARDVGHLEREIVKTEAALKTLARQFDATGDTALFKQIRQESGTLTNLKAIRRELDGVGESAKKLGGSGGGIGGGPGSGLNFASLPFNPYVAGGAAAGGLALAPFVGAAAGGALLGGAALGATGAGVAGAMQTKQVGDAWVTEAARVKASWLEASAAFEGPTMRAAKLFGQTMDKLDIENMLSKAARFVDPIADGLARAVLYLGEGLDQFLDDADPVVDVLGREIPETARATKIALEAIGDGADGGAEGLTRLFKVTQGVIVGTGRFIGFFEDAFRVLGDFQEKVNDVYQDIADVPVIGPVLGGIGEKISGIGLEADGFGRAMEGARTSTDGAATSMDAFGKVGGDAFYGIDQKARDAADTMKRLNDEFKTAVDNALGLSNAAIAVEQDWDDLAEGFKRGSDALDINTQKGRDNQEMINDTIADLGRRRQAEIDAGGATAEAYAKANANYAAGKKRLEDFLVSMGIARDKAHALVEELAKITDKSVTVRVNFIKTGDVSAEGVISGGDPRRSARSAYASGTTSARRGVALVGERGPELVSFDGGEQVYNAGATASMMRGGPSAIAWSAGGSGQARPPQIVYSGTTAGLESMFLIWLENAVRTGQLQVVP